MNRFLTVFALTIFVSALQAQVRLPRLVSDSMILQRDSRLQLWGWASPGERMSIQFNEKMYKAKAGADGTWNVWLPPMKAGGPYSMTIAGKNRITIKNILIGDVWFCSGQSNMVHQMNIHDVTYAQDIAEANYPVIRQFLVPVDGNLQGPQSDLSSGTWKAAIGDNVRPFSAVAYFFARKLYERYRVPIGIINASVGGTPVEAWTSEEGLKDFSALLHTLRQNKDTAYVNHINSTALAAGRLQPPADLGLASGIKWYDPAYAPKGWRNINIPGYWEDQGIKDLDGVVWYRREIDIPVSMTGMPAKVFLGRIVDADELYINGKQVGNTTYQYPQRRYNIPAGVLQSGKNIFVIRVINHAGKGGFVPDKPYCVFTGSDTIDLKGYWQYKVGSVFTPSPPLPSAIAVQNQPSALYNGMVAPLIHYGIKGILWYQGESNTGNPEAYAQRLPALIADWRHQWRQPGLSFIYAQLPNFMEYNYLPSESNWAALREAQRKTLSVPNTAMTVNIDLGEWNDIHPDNKKDVGERMALAAFKVAYGENVIHSGPLFRSVIAREDKMIISFTSTGKGLITGDGEALRGFALAGADRKFVWAKATIKGNEVVVWNEKIPHPEYVRYGWADNPDANLYNLEGLPASPFQAVPDNVQNRKK